VEVETTGSNGGRLSVHGAAVTVEYPPTAAAEGAAT
jgi:hypothetical protein